MRVDELENGSADHRIDLVAGEAGERRRDPGGLRLRVEAQDDVSGILGQ